MKHLVIGGVRSGKSAFAEKLATDCVSQKVNGITQSIVYLATSKILDEGMQTRIDKHKVRRPSEWLLVEEPYDLAAILSHPDYQQSVILIECISMWLTNLICLEDQQKMSSQLQNFEQALEQTKANVIMVTSEIGLGVMPMNAMARDFADHLGELNQQLAQVADKVTLVSAGLPLALK